MTEEDVDLRNDIARSTYSGMLHDTERHQKYAEALKCTIHEMSSKTHIHALDIGCGTGILSMMAAKGGANSVTACEMFKPISDTAVKIVKQNNFRSIINVVNKCSTDLQIGEDMASRADILVSEIFDSEIIGEGVLPTLRDAHSRLLAPDCKVIPSSAEVNVQLIQCEKLWCMHKVNRENVTLKFPKTFSSCPGTASGHEVQISQLYPNHLKFLANSTMLTRFDFSKPHAHTFNQECSMIEKQVNIMESGNMHAILFWWDLILHEGKQIVLSLEPKWMRDSGKYIWRDHWMQTVYYLKEPLKVIYGDSVFVSMFHDDYSVWFDVKGHSAAGFVDRPFCFCGLHMAWSRERFALLNNLEIPKMFSKLVLNSDIVSLMGDISFIPLFCGKKQLIYYECSELSQPIIKDIFLENYPSENLRMIKAYEEQPSLYNALLIDPYFSSCVLPWHHMIRLWKIVDGIQSLVNMKLKFYPARALLKGCIVELADLWKVHAPVKNIIGFDIREFDTLIEEARSPTKILDKFYRDVEPFSMWEYENILLGEPTVLAKFNFESSLPVTNVHFTNKLTFSRSGVAHAVVLWVDFLMDNENVFTMGLDSCNTWVDYMRQGVYFVDEPKHFSAGEALVCNVVLVSNNLELMFSFTE